MASHLLFPGHQAESKDALDVRCGRRTRIGSIMKMSTPTVDVILVGGGSAGVILAVRLRAAAQHAAAQQRHDVSAGKPLLGSSVVSSKIVGA